MFNCFALCCLAISVLAVASISILICLNRVLLFFSEADNLIPVTSADPTDN